LTYLSVFEVLEGNATYRNLNPRCEPQLGKRGLYRAIAGAQGDRTPEMAMLWVLNLSDGTHSLLDIAARSKIGFPAIRKAAEALLDQLVQDGDDVTLSVNGQDITFEDALVDDFSTNDFLIA
jgi:aminopeptidase-like protein